MPEGTILALEKPFGTDLDSARALNRRLEQLVPERQIHRIDHFLGKSTVLNLLGLRFANRIFESVWNADNIAEVEITFDERLALEGRAGYYDKAGALADMLQSHLLLVLALVAMEPPSSLEPDDLRGAMAQALRATRVWDGDAAAASRRARYTAGTMGTRQLVPYTEEPGVDPARETETLAEVRLGIENWRWAGVPFILRSGKALSDDRKEIVVTFKDVPHLPTGFSGAHGQSRLRIALTPDEIGRRRGRSTAKVTRSISRRRRFEPRSARGTCHRTARYCPACCRTTRPCRSGRTSWRSAGGSSHRCSPRGPPTKCHWKTTRPVPPVRPGGVEREVAPWDQSRSCRVRCHRGLASSTDSPGRAAEFASRAWFFCFCVFLVIIWAPSILLIRDIDTWQLIINTLTTIITFLMVALLQNSQTRADLAVQHKLNAIADMLSDLARERGLEKDARELRDAVGLERMESTSENSAHHDGAETVIPRAAWPR